MANVRHVNVVVKTGKVSINVAGKSSCQQSDLRQLASLLGEIMDDLKYEGAYVVHPERKALPGRPALKGISVCGVNHNIVEIAYQPAGNDSRAEYSLRVGPEAQAVYTVLKEYIGTAYNGKTLPKARSVTSAEEEAIEAATEVDTGESSETSKPTKVPEGGYFADKDWVDTTVLLFLEAEDENRTLAKSQVSDIIFSRTHYPQKFQLGPIFTAFVNRGFLIPVDGNRYKVKPEPKPQQAKAKKAKAEQSRKQKYLDDEEWMLSFVDSLHELVKESAGIISRTELNQFVKQRAGQKKVAGVVGKIVAGLKAKLILIENGDAYYSVTYDPPANIVEQVVEGMEAARQETAKVFNGFAKFRLPDFAEGMFKNTSILDEFLFLAAGDGAKPAFLKEKLAELYPVSSWSHIQLLNYMIGQGYLVRSSAGKCANYTLGPKGLQRLGLPVKVLPIVAAKAPTSVVDKSPEVAPPVPTPPQAPAVELSKPSQEPSVEAAPAPAKLDPKVVQATAQVLAKAMADMGSADLVEARNAELRARRDALLLQKAQGPSPEVIESAYLKALVEIADRL